MTGADHPSLSLPPEQAGLPQPTGADRVRTARRWAVGVLAVATLLLVAYLALVLVAVWLVGAAIDVLSSQDVGSLDVAGLFVTAVPGLLVGWCVGLGATWVLARGEALGARAAGLTSGAVGVLGGAAVLAATGVL
ncbi:hypothetical protein LL946_05135 [Knoellia locipacati]|uniref:hypothetical protein n=1 Tax=Knoellia locipacati TaxID=882824 RepID=UPI00384F47DF